MPIEKWSIISARETIEILSPCFGGSSPIHHLRAMSWVESAISKELLFTFREVVQHYQEKYIQGAGRLTVPVKTVDCGPVGDFFTVDTDGAPPEEIRNPNIPDFECDRSPLEFGWFYETSGLPTTLNTVMRYRLPDKEYNYFSVACNIRFAKEQILWLVGAPGGTPPAKTKRDTIRMSGNPYPKQWDWEGALIYMVRVADLDGLPQGVGINGRGRQTRIEEIMKQWFEDRNDGNSPSDSEIRRRAKRIIDFLSGLG